MLQVLLWKNFKLKQRKWGSTCLEFILPLVFVVLFTVLKGQTDVVLVERGWTEEVSEDSCPVSMGPASFNKTCGYPMTRFVTDITGYAAIAPFLSGQWDGHATAKVFLAAESNKTELFEAIEDFIQWVTDGNSYEGPVSTFRNQTFMYQNGLASEMIAYAESDDYGLPEFTDQMPEIALAIVFNKWDRTNSIFDYTIRMNSTNSANTLHTTTTNAFRPVTDNIQKDLDWKTRYMKKGFMTFQLLLDSYILSNGTKSTESDFVPHNIRMMPMPIDSYLYDEFFASVKEVISLAFIMCFLYPVAQLVSGLVYEKESRMTEMMQMMGVNPLSIVLSWYITYIAYFFILALVISIIGADLFPTTYAAGGASLIFMLFFLFGISTLALCYTLSTMFWRSRTASIVGVVAYFMGFFVYYQINQPNIEKPATMLLLPQVAFALAIQTIAVLESKGAPLDAAELWVEVEGFKVGDAYVMILLDFFLYSFLGWYLDKVLKQEFGQREPYLFFLKPSYWHISLRGYNRVSLLEEDALTANHGEDIYSEESVEDVPASQKAQYGSARCVQLRNLRKVFNTPDGKKVAVKGLDLDMFEGEILALLGHNGAGKTTTLQMLGGMLTPSDGTAYVLGKELRHEMKDIRKSLGFCPQHDVLYPTLTVAEHLYFYGRIKGLSGRKLAEQIDVLIAEVGLKEKVNAKAKVLSGGQKRKLSVAVALIGDSKVVFLDEPTSGMDTYSRRSTWEILQNNREGRIMVLTTHFMDEADILGDRIAIMAEGRLKCCGSSLFLKQRYGCGYTLTCVKKEQNRASDALLELIKSNIAGYKKLSDVGSEISFQLPQSESRKFPLVMKQLDADTAKYGIEQYGISVTTMEEVFLKVAKADDQNDLEDVAKNNSRAAKLDVESGSSLVEDNVIDDQLTERQVFRNHLGALFVKRLHYSRRDCRSFCCSTIIPVVLFGFGLLMLKFAPIGKSDPEYVISFGTDDFNPATRERPGGYDPNAFLPVMEYDETGNVTRRLMQQGLFDPAIQLVQFPEISLDSPVEMYQRTYVDGVPSEEECALFGFANCQNKVTSLEGRAMLNISDVLLSKRDQESIYKGASVYQAVVAQPQPVVFNSRCFQVSDELGQYVPVTCPNAEDGCLYAESTVSGITACLPLGCTYGQSLDFAGIRLTDAESAQLRDDVDIFISFGDLSNYGPSSLAAPSVCRGSPSGTWSKSNCVADHLVQVTVDVESGKFSVDPTANYCTFQEFREEAAVLFPYAGNITNATIAPQENEVVQVAGGRQCYVSDFPAELDELVATQILLVSTLNLTTGFNDTERVDLSAPLGSASGNCALDGANCTVEVFDAGFLGAICVPESCDDQFVNDTIVQLFGGFADPILDTIQNTNGTIYSCSDVPAACNTTQNTLLFAVADDALNFTLANITELQQLAVDAFNDLNATQFLNTFNLTQFNLTQFNLTALLNGDPDELNAFITSQLSPELVADLLLVAGNSTNQTCVDEMDQCLLSEFDLGALGILCLPLGCKGQIDSTFDDLPLFSAASANIITPDTPSFSCNSTFCNYGCRNPSNCQSSELTPVTINLNIADDSTTFGSSDVCDVEQVLKLSYLAMVNSTSRHGQPLTMNLMSNALLRLQVLLQSNGTIEFESFEDIDPDASPHFGSNIPEIIVRTHPLPLTANLKNLITSFLAFTSAIFCLIAFAFIPAAVAGYVVLERASGIKHQQLVSGVGIMSYWVSMFLFDFFAYMMPFCCTLGLIQMFEVDPFIDDGAFVASVFLFLGYGLAVIPFAYCLSNLFTSYTNAQIGVLFINLLTGLILMMTSFVMSILDDDDLNDLNRDLVWVYRLFPGFCLGDALKNMATQSIVDGFLGGAYQKPSPWTQDVAGADIWALYVQAVVFLCAAVGMDMIAMFPSAFQFFHPEPRSKTNKTMQVADLDVVKEKKRMECQASQERDMLSMVNLRKVYRGGKVAVHGVSLGIPKGECFGYLGINGAGKTTTLKILTGDIYPTKGQAFINGYDIRTEIRKIRRLIGYCPQFDALLDNLTVEEHLQLYARIKGIGATKINRVVHDLLEEMTLTPFRSKLSKTLSGGNKRKLSVACAMIGSPKLMFLDEPSTGVDPVSRRFMWNVISNIVKRGTAVVLTTHSMEECEALCNRVTIMVGGCLRCLGSIQHLKSKYGQGLMMDIKLQLPSAKEVEVVVNKQVLQQLINSEEHSGLDQSAVESVSEKLDGNDLKSKLVRNKADEAWIINYHLERDGFITTELFAQWYLLQNKCNHLDAFLSKHFEKCTVVEKHEAQIKYNLPIINKDHPNTKLCNVFQLIEDNKAQLNIEEYSVSQTSLESIFNAFASQQEEETGVARGMTQVQKQNSLENILSVSAKDDL